MIVTTMFMFPLGEDKPSEAAEDVLRMPRGAIIT